MTPIDTAELERLAAEMSPGPWQKNPENTVCTQIDGKHHAICTDQFCYPPEDEKAANARAIALVPELIREVLAHRKAEAGMRALLRAGCDLLAIESEALRNSIRIVGNPDRMSDAPEDAHAVDTIREIEDWIASVKATLYPATPEAEGGCDERA